MDKSHDTLPQGPQFHSEVSFQQYGTLSSQCKTRYDLGDCILNSELEQWVNSSSQPASQPARERALKKDRLTSSSVPSLVVGRK